MKLLYSGGIFCDEATLKRLLLIAEEIGFMDRPGVMFEGEQGEWGLIAEKTPARRIDSKEESVQINAFAPPGFEIRSLREKMTARDFYQHYAETDIANPSFTQTVLEGLRDDHKFSARLLALEGNYGGITGAEIRSALVKDDALWTASLDPSLPSSYVSQIDSPAAIKNTLKSLIVEASIHVTSAMVVSNETGFIPVTDDSHLARLLALRTSDARYLGEATRAAPRLGIEMARAVVPDEMLQHLTIRDVFEYRSSAKDAYEAWLAEVNKLAVTLDGLGPDEIEKGIAKTLVSDVTPRVVEYKNEMRSVRDKLWGDLLKKVATWEMPSLAIGYMVGTVYSQALMLFAGAIAPGVPPLVDYFRDKRAAKRNHAISYLIGLAPADCSDR